MFATFGEYIPKQQPRRRSSFMWLKHLKVVTNHLAIESVECSCKNSISQEVRKLMTLPAANRISITPVPGRSFPTASS